MGVDTVEYRSLLGRHFRRGYNRAPIASDTIRPSTRRFSDSTIGADTVEYRSLLGRHFRRGYSRVQIASDTAVYRIASRTTSSVRIRSSTDRFSDGAFGADTVEYRSLPIRLRTDRFSDDTVGAKNATLETNLE